jgi:hypothetical protein
MGVINKLRTLMLAILSVLSLLSALCIHFAVLNRYSKKRNNPHGFAGKKAPWLGFLTEKNSF